MLSRASRPFQTICAAVSGELQNGDPAKAYEFVDELIRKKPMGPVDRRCMLALRIAVRSILRLRAAGLPPGVDLEHFFGTAPDFELDRSYLPALEAVLAEDVPSHVSTSMMCPNCGSAGVELGWAHPVRATGVPHGRFYVDPEKVLAKAAPDAHLSAEHAHILATIALANLDLRIPVLGCTGCELRYLAWERDDEIEDHYVAPPGGGFDLNGERAFGRGNVFSHVYEKAGLPLYLEGLFGGVEGLAMYEFGCAEGVMASLLGDLGAQVKASDLDKPKIHYGREIMGLTDLSDEADYFQALPERSLDCVYAFHTVEHLQQPDAFLDAFTRSLKVGGHLVVSVPNLIREETGQIGDMGGDHLIGFDPDSLKMFFRRHGLEIVDCIADDGHLPADKVDPVREAPVWAGRRLDLTIVGRRAA